MMEFVIIGADAAGMSAASRAKRKKPDLKVTVFEKTTDVSYSACGMPYNIADPTRGIDDLVVRPADVFRQKQNIRLLTGHLVEEIDPVQKTVRGVSQEGNTFQASYDKLLLATGAAPILPQKPGFDLEGVLGLKQLADGRRIKAYLEEKPVKKVVIMGMGYIALEMAESLGHLGIEVCMIKPGPVLLPWLAEPLSAAVAEELEAHNVRLFLGHDVERIEQRDGKLALICPDMTLEGDMVLVAVGVKPNSVLALNAELALGPSDSVATDRSLFTSNAHILAAGDCADAYHVVTGEKAWIPLALRANRAGWAAADNVCGKAVELPGIAGTAVFRVFELEVARTGLNTLEAQTAGFDPVDVFIKTRSRAHAHPGAATIRVHMVGDKQTGRLLGMQMVGKEGVAHRINAPAVALHAQLTVAAFSQSDLAYAPPFGPTWDPTLTAANQLLKDM